MENQTKIYSKTAIKIAAILGGPIAVAYIVAHNFKVLKERSNYRKTIAYSILYITVLFIASISIPEDILWPNVVFPLILLGISLAVYSNYQEEKVKRYIEQGGKYKSNWLSALQSLLFLIVMLALFLGVYMLVENSNIAYNYHSKVYHNNTIQYNSDHISDTEIDFISEKLYEVGYYNDTEETYLLIDKEGETYVLYVSVYDEYKDDEEVLSYYQNMRDVLYEQMENQEVQINMVVDSSGEVYREIN